MRGRATWRRSGRSFRCSTLPMPLASRYVFPGWSSAYSYLLICIRARQVGPFFAGFAATGHVVQQNAGVSKWGQQCIGVDVAVVWALSRVCFSMLYHPDANPRASHYYRP